VSVAPTQWADWLNPLQAALFHARGLGSCDSTMVNASACPAIGITTRTTISKILALPADF
jgi:hypothetical protein